MFKAIIIAATLAVARAGFLGAPAAIHAGPIATYAAAAPVAHYSAAPAVSSSYIHQSHAPAVAAIHAAPAIAAVHAAPAFHAAAPIAFHNPSIGATHQSVLRSYGGNQAVSHYSKAVDSPFSTVRKYDTRITNDALAVAPVAAYAHAAPIAYGSYAHHAAPLGYAHHAAPLGYAHHGYAHAAPIATYAAHAPVIAKTAAIGYSPAAVVSHVTFTGMGAHYGW